MPVESYIASHEKHHTLRLQSYQVESDTYATVSREYCMSIQPGTVKDGLVRYLHNGVHVRYDVIPYLKAKVEAVRKTLVDHPHCRYISVSAAFFIGYVLWFVAKEPCLRRVGESSCWGSVVSECFHTRLSHSCIADYTVRLC